MATVAQDSAPAIRLNEPAGRWVLLATVLGSSMAFLDATVVNVALPTITAVIIRRRVARMRAR
jgi:hypothetical protein